jgi:PAS domain S-box-containing protein
MSDLNTIVGLLKASPTPSVILHTHIAHRIAWVNPSALLLMKAELTDFVGSSIFDVFEDPVKHGHLFEKHGLRTTLLNSLTSKTASIPVVQRYKLVGRTTGGIKSHYYNCSAYPVFDHDDKVSFLVLTLQEVFGATNKFNAANAPLAAGIFDHPLFQDYPDAVFTLGRDGQFLSANKILLDIADCSYEALTQLSFPTFIVPEELEKVSGYFKRAINGEILNFDTKIISLKGNVKFLNLTHLPIISNREVIGVYLIAKDITARKQEEAKFQQARQQYQELFDLSPIPQFVYGYEDLFIKDVNQAAVAHYGYSKAEFLSMTIMDIRPAEDIPKVQQLLQEKFRPGMYHRGLYRHLNHNGDIMDMKVSGTLIVFEGIEAILAICFDVTAMRTAQKALRASEQRFRVLVQDGSDMIGIVDTDGTYRYVNQTTKKILGIPPEQFIGRNAFEFIHEQDIPQIEAAFQDLAEHKRIEIPPYRFIDGTGRYRWINTILTDMTHDPAVMGIVSNSRDITERIENELKMQKSIERFDIVSKATSDAIWDFDVASGVVFWNRALKSLFGYKDTTHTREWWLERLHPDDAARVTAKITDAVNGKKTRLKNEYRFRCADGSYKNVLDRSFLVFNDCSELVRIIGSMEDITERQLYIQTVEAQNKRLQEIGWTQSHLVRAPLANIMAIAELLSYEIQAENAARDLLSHLLKSAGDLDDIIRDIINKTEIIHKFKTE